MINSTTPYKLAEIIRDTWPNLYKETSINKLDVILDNIPNSSSNTNDSGCTFNNNSLEVK